MHDQEGSRRRQETALVQPVRTVVAEWDDEAHVWVASSEDVPGLVTEAETLEALAAKLAVMVPELLELNDGPLEGDREVPIDLVARLNRHDRRVA
jgi:predicted RNase H-like HicB family nuclease